MAELYHRRKGSKGNFASAAVHRQIAGHDWLDKTAVARKITGVLGAHLTMREFMERQT